MYPIDLPRRNLDIHVNPAHHRVPAGAELTPDLKAWT
jgi:hypothetical protein